VTQEEARVILNVSAFQNASVAFEQLLFEQKQWFASSKMIPKVISKRLEKLDVMHRASGVLGLQRESNPKATVALEFSEKLIERYNAYQKEANLIKLKIFQSENFEELSLVVKYYLELFRNYASVWPKFDGVEEIKLSQEIDPVFFYGELLALSRSGISTFEEFVKSAEKVGPEVKKESNRLYLLYRSFGDGSGVAKS
jgi:hypothetical protein